MFTTKEKKNLKTLLSRAVNPKEAFNLEELHGFLFGLAVMPEMIKPSEWLPVAFGEEMMEFKNSDEATALMGHLFVIYNRLNSEYHAGKLSFPFDIGSLKKGDIIRIRDWTNGFYMALMLRHEIWDFEGRDDDDLTEEERELTIGFGVIIAIARPEHTPEIFVRTDSKSDIPEDDIELQASLFAMLPAAVETVQAYAAGMREAGQSADTFMPPRSDHYPKIGRNDPCPCESGKKYKKCCGLVH